MLGTSQTVRLSSLPSMQCAPASVTALQARDGDAPSWYNAIEAGVVADLVSGLLQQGSLNDSGTAIMQADIGVIATFRRQVATQRLGSCKEAGS